MNKRTKHYFDSDYLLIIILLLFSGDPVTRYLGKYAMPVLTLVIFVVMYNKYKKDFYARASGTVVALLLLFISQYFVLGFVSWPASLNYINTFLFGGLIVYVLGDKLPHKLFIVIYYVSLISVFLFVFINLLNIHPPGIEWKPKRITYIVYSFVEEHRYRNSGPFWEPGAFGGILSLCMALNAKDLPLLWKEHKTKLIVIIIALMTTQSTTAYIVFFLIGSYVLLFFVKDKTIAFILLPLLLVVGAVVYSNAAFLQDKVESQSQSSLVLYQGEFSNTRFGSFIFDFHYIQKHPIIGNGFNEITRYADNPELIQLIQMGRDPANGNGLSNYAACLGIPFIFFYIVLSFNAISTIDRKVGFLVILTILLSLISEQWLTYPIYTGMIFFRNKKNLNE